MTETLAKGEIVFPLLVGIIFLFKTRTPSLIISYVLTGSVLWLGIELLVSSYFDEAREIINGKENIIYMVSGTMLVFISIATFTNGFLGERERSNVAAESDEKNASNIFLWALSTLFYIPVLIRVMDPGQLHPSIERNIKQIKTSWYALPIAIFTYICLFAVFVYSLFYKNWTS